MRRLVHNAIAVGVVVGLALGSRAYASPSPAAHASTAARIAQNAADVPIEADVVSVLQTWESRVQANVPDDIRAQIDAFAANYPLEAASGVEPVSMQKSDGEGLQLSPVVNRRDWAYAMQGAAYTLAATLAEGQQNQLDVGFWCYLQAALLRPDEAEHLANVGFHLNLRHAIDDARTVLSFARQSNQASAPIRNNLAFAYARGGDNDAAAAEEQWAAALRPDQPIYQERLADYWDAAGQPQLAQAIRVPLQFVGGDVQLGVPNPPLPTMSSDAQGVNGQIGTLAHDTGQQLKTLWDGYKPRLDAASRDLHATVDKLGQDYVSCATTGGADMQRACSACLPTYDAGFRSAVSSWYDTVKPLVTSYELDAFNLLGGQTQKGNDLIAASSLEPAEKQVLYQQVASRIFDTNYDSTTTASAWAAGERQSMLDLQKLVTFGLCQTGGPIEIAPIESTAPKPVRLDDPKKPNFTWPFYFNFLIGSLQRTTDGTYKLSLGQGLMAKMQLNVFTGETAAGLAVGADLPQGLKGEANLMFRPKFLNYRVEAGADLKLKLPSLLPLPVQEPAVGVRAVIFENSP